MQNGYVRRKQYAKCFNGQKFESIEKSVQCACTYDDYECDLCYNTVFVNGTKKCEWSSLQCGNSPPSTKAPEPCLGSYRVATGFRLIAGDNCTTSTVSAVDLLGQAKACPAVSTGSNTLAIILFVIVLLILGSVGGCFLLAQYNPMVREFWSRTVPTLIAPSFGKNSSSSATYSILRRPDTMDDDEEAFKESDQAKELDDDSIANYSKKSNQQTL